MARAQPLSDLQIAILRVLWDRGEATVAQVQAALQAERGLAHTTVATLLSRLAARGVVARRSEGRQHVYRATVEEQDVKRSMVSALTERLFAGDPSALVHHLIDEGEIDADELTRLRKLLAKKRAKKGGRRAR
ncbi:MAG: BlaI/MecI/CopY family transcriptional regulator [Planctomycetota bacterium]|nr:BlaI/MecI/CopY family transcriptional regulator [Planctomycetota bacterium]